MNLGNGNSLPNRWLGQVESKQNEAITKRFLDKEYPTDQAPTSEQYTKIATNLAANK
jgi:hypothetical protein